MDNNEPQVLDGEDGAVESTPMVDLAQSKAGKGGKDDGKEIEAPSNEDESELLEKEPLRSNEVKEEITVEIGEEGKEEKPKSPSPLPPKKGCDVRCLVIGILVLVIMVGGAAVAILAHRFKGKFTAQLFRRESVCPSSSAAFDTFDQDILSLTNIGLSCLVLLSFGVASYLHSNAQSYRINH